ncbi:hypothetical protein F2Q70_00022261 [Brassica cretica]|uniref:Uncharacterized protein n=1 Tax=Brassica cretica TaxID=69181 RepID=A0A8S9GJQ6_BRACR|nr:hypothetical protein F2Q70_00022261 [Brassica cretica]
MSKVLTDWVKLDPANKFNKKVRKLKRNPTWRKRNPAWLKRNPALVEAMSDGSHERDETPTFKFDKIQMEAMMATLMKEMDKKLQFEIVSFATDNVLEEEPGDHTTDCIPRSPPELPTFTCRVDGSWKNDENMSGDAKIVYQPKSSNTYVDFLAKHARTMNRVFSYVNASVPY